MRFSWVDCDQCVTIRILLQRALRSIKRDTQQFFNIDPSTLADPTHNGNFDVVTENVTAFYTALHNFQEASKTSDSVHYLILDRLDQLPDNTFDLITCLVRLQSISPVLNICPIFVTSSLEQRAFVTTHIPHIRFPQYTKDETSKILSTMKTLCRLPDSCLDQNETKAELQSIKFWDQYCNVLINALSSYTGSDIRLIKEIAKKLWQEFIDPVVKGRFEVEEFLSIYRENQELFTSERAVADKLISTSLINPSNSVTGTGSGNETSNLLTTTISKSQGSINELPLQSKYIICAAYLASYNPPRFDIRFFSRAKEARAKRRDTGRRKLLKINPRLLAAPAFDLERMLAILHAIAPSTSTEMFTDEHDKAFPSNVDIGAQIATLTELRLITRTSSSDPLDSRTRWRINASWNLVEKISKEIGIDLYGFLME